MILDRDILVARHREEIEELQVKIEVLQKQLETKRATVDLLFGLTRTEARIFLSVWNRHISSHDDLISAMYFDCEEPECSNVVVYIHRIRKKIKPFGIKILSEHNRGYMFDLESRKIIKSMMDEYEGALR